MDENSTPIPADDLLDGVRGFAAFTGFSERRCFYMLEKGYLPGGKIGANWIGSKRKVREFLDSVTSGAIRASADVAVAAEA